MRNLILLAVVAILVAGCRRTDVRDFQVDLPEMSAADLPAARAALAPYGGVDQKSLVFDEKSHRLTMKYDSMMIAKKNIEMALAKAGFTANGVTPESIGAKRKSN